MTPVDFESDWLHGLHDPGGEHIMLEARRPGWIVFTQAIGHDPADRSGFDFRPFSDRGLGVICRLNNGYHPAGTIPGSQHYRDFAQRCANFVAASPGCKIWIIGNEPNFAIERPYSAWASGQQNDALDDTMGKNSIWTALGGLFSRARSLFARMGAAAASSSDGSYPPIPDDPFYHGHPDRFSALRQPVGPEAGADMDSSVLAAGGGEVITPELYARCYRLCWNAIHRLPAHEVDEVLVAAVAPWNNQTVYAGNPFGDWVQYFADILRNLGPEACDGFALHAYTHGPEPERIQSEATMQPPFTNRRFEFRVYRDFLDAVPDDMRRLPVYITEADQEAAWLDRNSGWVQQAYAEITSWNRIPGAQTVRSLALYRWPRFDRWYIEGKSGVIDDFRAAIERDYRWRTTVPAPAEWRKGTVLETTTIVNLRRTPGFIGQSEGDVVAELPYGTRLQVLENTYREADSLIWWPVRTLDEAQSGWAAQFATDGRALLVWVADEADEPTDSDGEAPTGTEPFDVGDIVQTLTFVRLRRSPGYQNKPEEDILAEVRPLVRLRIVGGPQDVDGLRWWQVESVDGATQYPLGWMADAAPDGQVLLANWEDDGLGSEPAAFTPSDVTWTVNFVRLRRTPGLLDKGTGDIIADIWQNTPVRILSGPSFADDLMWWYAETTDTEGRMQRGWMATSAPGNIPLLAPLDQQHVHDIAARSLAVVAEVPVRVRNAPGITNKPEDDVIAELGKRMTLHVLAGPKLGDTLRWWQVVGIASSGEITGWIAQKAPGGVVLARLAPKLPRTDIPDHLKSIYLGAPYEGQFGIAQLWGENPEFYARYSYDGVSLTGHNGVDFLTPLGTNILACDHGQVAAVGFEGDGFGLYILLNHDWGQSIYAHLDRADVLTGQTVGRGAVMGKSGTSGASTGPHLHFALRILPFERADGWGGYSDPLPYMRPQDTILPRYFGGGDRPGGVFQDVGEDKRLPPSAMAADSPDLVRP